MVADEKSHAQKKNRINDDFISVGDDVRWPGTRWHMQHVRSNTYTQRRGRYKRRLIVSLAPTRRLGPWSLTLLTLCTGLINDDLAGSRQSACGEAACSADAKGRVRQMAASEREERKNFSHRQWAKPFSVVAIIRKKSQSFTLASSDLKK